MIDVLVTCHRYTKGVTSFPEVRGHYLAKHLARSGLTAEFRPLPVPVHQRACEVLICSEYQAPMTWFDRKLAAPLSEIRADRMFCMTDFSLYGRPNHFSLEYCRWFLQRGGLLVHRESADYIDGEHWIGLGVDSSVVRPSVDARRDRVLFDFPKSKSIDSAAQFDVKALKELRRRLPNHRFVGTGPSDARIRKKFDQWIPYGQDHRSYVTEAFARSFAVVPGCDETLGMAMAEAQVAGACVVSAECGPPDDVLVPEAAISCDRDVDSMAAALTEASGRDARCIREAAMAKFDFAAVADRTRAAIGI